MMKNNCAKCGRKFKNTRAHYNLHGNYCQEGKCRIVFDKNSVTLYGSRVYNRLKSKQGSGEDTTRLRKY